MRGPRLLTSTESWNDSMLAAPQSAARRAKWGQRYSDFNACQEQADIHQGLLVRSGDRLFSPQLFFSTFQKWHSKFATHRQAAGLQCSTLGIVAPGKATTDLKPRATASYPNRESTKPSSAITRKKKSRAAA
jgi:hypothetical protein